MIIFQSSYILIATVVATPFSGGEDQNLVPLRHNLDDPKKTGRSENLAICLINQNHDTDFVTYSFYAAKSALI